MTVFIEGHMPEWMDRRLKEAREGLTMQSWKPEVQADATDQWYANGLRFATKEEAEFAARDLTSRWSAVRKWRVMESDDPVNSVVTPKEDT